MKLCDVCNGRPAESFRVELLESREDRVCNDRRCRLDLCKDCRTIGQTIVRGFIFAIAFEDETGAIAKAGEQMPKSMERSDTDGSD